MFSQFFVQIFALYNFFRKNLRKKMRKFSMDPIWVKGPFLAEYALLKFSEAVRGGRRMARRVKRGDR